MVAPAMSPPRHALAVVGLAGTGKTSVTEQLVAEFGYKSVHFGGFVTDEVKRRGLDLVQASEKIVREELRTLHGMAAIAMLGEPAIAEKLAANQLVAIDGLYSFAEWEYLHDRFPLRLLAIHASRTLRHQRMAIRPVRPLTAAELDERDVSEIKILDKGGPIAIADHHIVNDGTLDELHNAVATSVDAVWKWAGNVGLT